MISYLITIEATDKGIATHGFNVKASTDPMERTVAGILDLAVDAAFKFVAQETSKITGKPTDMIDGKDISAFVSRELRKAGAFDFRESLKSAGYELPPE